MPLILILRFLFSLLSLAILASAAYFLWRWYDGFPVRDAAGVVHRVREEWPLWVGLGALSWSILGGFIMKPLVGEPDKRKLNARRSKGQQVQSPTGSSLYVEMHGEASAPPIILTHGWGLDSTIWAYAVEDLSSRFRVITWDLPGLGRSKGKIDLESFATDLQAVTRLTGAERVVLVGHSIGGMTIQTLVRDHPEFVEERVAGIVLLNTTYTNPLKTMVMSRLLQALRWPVIEPLLWLAIPLQPFVWLSAWQSYLSGSAHLANRLGFGKHASKSQLNTVTLLATRNPPGAQARGTLAMLRWDATAALSKLRLPVLVIGGELDIVTKSEASRRLSESATNGRLVMVKDVNHMGFLERYDIYNAAIGQFADDVLSRPHLASRAVA